MASALAIGCIYRSKGGIALLGVVGHAAETLIAVARASSGISHIWLLHSLWLVANAAGLSFIPNVKVCPSLVALPQPIPASQFHALQRKHNKYRHRFSTMRRAPCMKNLFLIQLDILQFQSGNNFNGDVNLHQEVLNLETELLMSEEANAVPGLRPVLGRLANAMVAVLGPEMSLGSASYTKTRTLLLDLQVSAYV